MRTQTKVVLRDYHSELEDKQYSEQTHRQAIEFQKEMEKNKESPRNQGGTSSEETKVRTIAEPSRYKKIQARVAAKLAAETASSQVECQNWCGPQLSLF